MRKGKGRNNGLLPNSLRIISSCLKTVSANASNVASTVRSAGATVAASISASEDQKDQVTWAGFDRLELGPSTFKKVLLLGYQNGFQVLDVEDASNFIELASKRDGPVSFLQLQPLPQHSDDSHQKLKASHPMLLVVAGDETNTSGLVQNPVQRGPTARDVQAESHSGNSIHSPTTVRFFSLRSHCYVHVLRFRSSVCMVRCSSRVIAVGLATQIYCFDAITLENKFSVLTYPVPQLAGQGGVGISVGYGPMAVGPRWLAYASNSPFISNTGRLSPQNLSPSPGVSPSTSPGGSSLVARYARESSKQLATGLLNLGDMGYKSLSKCYQELLPDGSNSPVSPNSVWKVGRPAVTDMDNAGMVVVKDFVSRAVILQFKAHSSAISALCFDPSGTLLVTASIHGNNINIFRIMPSLKRTGSGAQNYDWSSSHVHLYQLHRGITSAMIQDICFSNFSQWVAIVSSKGTCHIFVLSPFGGDAGFQTFVSHGKEPSLFPILTLPWWSTSSCVINQHSCPPPPPATLSVVSRIKYSSFGWLNTVSSASGSSTGKVFVPSGAVASVFHNSISDSLQHVNSRTNSLEHLLVFTPSGHVVQHELLPSIGVDSGDNGSRTQSASHFHSQEDDLRVKVEPVRWWDVCRRSDWAEREECISQTKFERQDASGVIPNSSGDDSTCGMNFLEINGSVGGQKASKVLSVKSQERSHWYLSNAEVQVNTGRLPIWQKSKISFYMMEPPRLDVLCGGEFEIEKVSLHEVEIRCKELLPVYDHFPGTKSGWNDRCFTEGKNPPHLEAQHGEYKVTQETITCHSKPSSLSSTESSEGGSSRRMENLLDMDQMNYEKSYSPTRQILSENCPVQNGSNFPELSFLSRETLIVKSSPFQHSENINSYAGEPIKSSLPALEYKSSAPSGGITEEAPSSDSGEFSMLSTNHFDSDNTTTEESPTVSTAQNLLDFELLREEHYRAETKCSNVNEAVNDDVDSSSVHSEKEKTDEDGENDDMLGGMFAFFEED